MSESDRLESVAATGLSAQPDSTMDRLAELVARLLGAEIGLVSLVDDQRQFFPGQHGLPDPLSRVRETPLEQSVCRTVVETNDVVAIVHAAHEPAWAQHGARLVLGVESYLGAPLLDRAGQVLGSLCALNSGQRAWTDDDRRTLSDLAAGASAALQARIATTVADRASARLQLVADTSLVLQETFDVEALLVALLEILVPHLADRAAIMLTQNGENEARVVRRTAVPTLRTVIDPPDAQLDVFVGQRDVASVLDRARPYSASDAAATQEMRSALAPNDPGHADPTGGRGSLVVPISSADEALGVIVLIASATQPFSVIDIALACDIGRRAGAALSNARAFQRERAIAIALQRNLLAALPDVPEVELAAAYQPALHGSEIGGDWYDVFTLPHGRFAATIGDVTGHSIDAAAAMARMLVAIRCFAFDDRDPAEILRRLDRMGSHLLGDRLATCQYLVVEPPIAASIGEHWRVTIANAGHLPPVLIHPDGSSAFVDVPRDPLIGLAGTHRRTAFTIDVEAGSILILYTDGLIERRREHLDVGLERLRAAAEAADRATSMHALSGAIIAATLPDGTDDVAMLCLRLGTRN